MMPGGSGVTQTEKYREQIQNILAQIWEDLPAIPEGTERDRMIQALLQMEQAARFHLKQHKTGDEH